MKKKYLFVSLLLSLTSCNSGIIEYENHSISIIKNEFIRASVSTNEAKINDLITINIEEISPNYELRYITANNHRIDDFSFLMPNEDVSINFILGEKDKDCFKVEIENSEFALIYTEKQYYFPNEVVTIEYSTRSTYELDYFLINGEKIVKDKFIMPSKDVEIRGVFKDALTITDITLEANGGGIFARSYWDFKYDTLGVRLNVKVEDNIVRGKEMFKDPGYRDNIEFIISKPTSVKGWNLEAVKTIISCDGGYYIQKPSSLEKWGTPLSCSFEDFNFNATIKSKEKKDGFNGYEINAFISYNLLSTRYIDAKNSLFVSLSQRNATNYNSNGWTTYEEDGTIWEDCSTFPTLINNKLVKGA